jgi:uncharacterized integral membrane protein (TIGR02327 family)
MDVRHAFINVETGIINLWRLYMQYFLMNLAVHVLSFTLSFWALSCVRFETFTNVRKPGQVRLLLLLLSLGLGYLVAQFLLAISVYNGL